jgi:ribosomal-protein-alanine N-acetyltransferase
MNAVPSEHRALQSGIAATRQCPPVFCLSGNATWPRGAREPAPNPNDGTLEQACHRVAAKSAKGFADGVSVHFIATDRETGAVVAGCNFTNIVRGIFQACHLGYSVDHAWQGKGLMFEVAQAGIAYMFDNQGLHRIMANHMPANVRSEKLLRRLGFEREGFARAYLKINGQWQDHVLNALVNEPP